MIASQENDWERVAAELLGPVPGDKPIWYQKHMAHHLLPEMGLGWMDELTHCFLIRSPREVIASYSQKRAEVTLDDTGVVRQWEIFDWVRARTGQAPPVIDARDVLEHPREVLSRLCARIGVDFDERMLRWRAGPRDTDGVWAKHWYDAVVRSTSFGAWKPPAPIGPELERLAEEAEPHYRKLHELRIVPGE